jgi:outer membrane receptor protein involved in Fe transport
MSSARIPGSLRRPVGKPASAGPVKKDASVTTLVTAACLAAASPATIALAQTAPAQSPPSQSAPLPPLSVEAKQQKKKATPAPAKKSGAAVAAPAVPATPAVTVPAPNASGDIGYNATRTSTATKTDTPLRNVPQSVSVVTQDQGSELPEHQRHCQVRARHHHPPG